MLSDQGVILCGGQALSLDKFMEAAASWRSMMHTVNRLPKKLAAFYTGTLGQQGLQLFIDMKFDQLFTERYADDPAGVVRDFSKWAIWP